MMRRQQLHWITRLALLGMIVLLAGCSLGQPQATSPASPEPGTGANPSLTESSMTPTQPTNPDGSANLANPGFEEQTAGGVPVGWQIGGDAGTVKLEDRGHGGQLRLTLRSDAAYRAEVSQAATGLADQWYTLHAWVRSSGGQDQAYISLICGETEKRTMLPSTSPGYRWLQVVVSLEVTGGQCTIRLVSEGSADTWASFDDIELRPGQTTLSILGADISSLKKSEDLGGVYKYADSTPGDALQILKDYGLNYARLRVWLDPADGYHNKDRLLEMALRLKALDIKLLVDFHYSDNWADPGKQNKPAAWKDYDFEQLKQAVYDHTYDVCSSLAAQGTPADMVQVGNEINSGLLWPDGDYNHFDNMAALLKEGARAVKDAHAETKVMLHIAEGGDNDLARWWFGAITSREVPFDVIGISYYPYWHGSLPELQANLNDISARYDKDVVVVETAYAFTPLDNDGYPNIVDDRLMVANYTLSPDGQLTVLRDVMTVVRSVNNGRGLGVFYWDATWIAVPGNGWDNTNPSAGNAWENQALFDFAGVVLPALFEYQNP